jgi:carbamoyltransferase
VIILGFYCGHDANACLIKNGEVIVAIEKERLTRKKSDRGNADLCIQYCLDTAGISLEEIDCIATSATIAPGHKGSSDFLSGEPYTVTKPYSTHKMKLFGHTFAAYNIQHHLGHASSAFFLSGFEDASILSIDGWGDFTATLLAKGSGNQIEVIDRPLCNLGFVWTAVSTTLGFSARYAEGKIMALAAYGQPRYYEALLDWCGGDLYNFRLQGKNRTYTQVLDEIWHGDVELLFNAQEDYHAIKFQDSDSVWYGIPLFRDVIKKGQHHLKPNQDLASTIQKLTEDIMINFANVLYEKTNSQNLCIVGGVGLNCVANRKILDRTPFKRIFIPPATHDGGLSVGLALYLHHVILGNNKPNILKAPYLGKEYTSDQIHQAIIDSGIDAMHLPEKTLYKKVAEIIADGRIVAWFQGRSEWGPRSLGNRSILCDPRDPNMKETLNKKVKHREHFRPFAPSVLLTYSQEFFDLDIPSPFMLMIANVKQGKDKFIPAVLHIDNTARLQTVTRDSNPGYYALIEAFHDLTGIPLLLNTSFNVAGEPIVETPTDAINCFSSTNIDYLVLDNFLLSKKER